MNKFFENWPMHGILFLTFVFGIIFTSGLEGKAETNPSVAIVPFLVQRVEGSGRGAVCPVCKNIYRSGEISPGAPNTLTRLLYEKMEVQGTFKVIPLEKVEEVLLPWEMRYFEERPVLSSIKVGKELGADFICIGYVFRFEERIGSSLGVQRPASVSFDLHLLRMRDEKMFWLGKFDETQRPLSENLLKMGSFLRRKGSWLKAAELASVGMDETLKKLPGPKELEER
jgi:hypothetical protein